MSNWPAPSTSTPVHATVTVPGSKSQTNRALVLAALATPQGESTISGALRSRDTDLMIGALQTLGVTVHGNDTELTVGGAIDPRPGATVDCGLAGTVLRFVPAVAALGAETVVFDGDEQARARPIAPLLDALRGLGVDIDGDGLPFSVRGAGSVAGGTVEIDASASSQFVSGLLLSGAAFTDGLTIVHTGESVPSAPHVAMTVSMLRDAGVDVDDTQANRWRVSPGPIAARHWSIEPDLSNAVPFLAAAVVSGGSVRLTGWPQVEHATRRTPSSRSSRSWVRLSFTVIRTSRCRGRTGVRRLRRGPARCRRADPRGGGAGRAGLGGFGLAAAGASLICADTRRTGWPRCPPKSTVSVGNASKPPMGW